MKNMQPDPIQSQTAMAGEIEDPEQALLVTKKPLRWFLASSETVRIKYWIDGQPLKKLHFLNKINFLTS